MCLCVCLCSALLLARRDGLDLHQPRLSWVTPTASKCTFSLSCKGVDLNGPVDVTCCICMSSSSARKKKQKGILSCTAGCDFMPDPSSWRQYSKEREQQRSQPALHLPLQQALWAPLSTSFLVTSEACEVRPQQKGFSAPHRTDANQYLCCKGLFHFPLIFLYFLLIFII